MNYKFWITLGIVNCLTGIVLTAWGFYETATNVMTSKSPGVTVFNPFIYYSMGGIVLLIAGAVLFFVGVFRSKKS